MKRTMIASVLSIALAATSFTAAPARADEDVFKVIAGLVVLGALANAAKRSNHSEATVGRQHPQPIYRAPKPPRHSKVAPRHCLTNQWTHRGNRQVYSASCAQKHTRARLPQSCLRQAKQNSGPRYFYTKKCLSQKGWRV